MTPYRAVPRVQLAARLIEEINPDVDAKPLQMGLVSPDAFEAVKGADWVFGCFDEDGPRFVLNELCSAYKKPYIDLASDIHKAGVYGGRVCNCMGRTQLPALPQFARSERCASLPVE